MTRTQQIALVVIAIICLGAIAFFMRPDTRTLTQTPDAQPDGTMQQPIAGADADGASSGARQTPLDEPVDPASAVRRYLPGDEAAADASDATSTGRGSTSTPSTPSDRSLASRTGAGASTTNVDRSTSSTGPDADAGDHAADADDADLTAAIENILVTAAQTPEDASPGDAAAADDTHTVDAAAADESDQALASAVSDLLRRSAVQDTPLTFAGGSSSSDGAASSSSNTTVNTAASTDDASAGEPDVASASSGRSIFDFTAETTRDESVPATYTVEAGDTLSTIAYRFYGSSIHWQRIADANPDLPNPDAIRAGQVIRLPRWSDIPQPTTTPQPTTADAPAGSTIYTVKHGETLWDIAKAHYGQGTLWHLIYEANNKTIGDNPDRVRGGMRLILPPKPTE